MSTQPRGTETESKELESRAEHQAGQASSFRQGPKEVVRLESSPADAERVLRMDREHETTISSTRNRAKVSFDSLNLPPTPQDSPMQKVDTAGALGQQKGRPKTGSNGRPDDVPGDSKVNSYALESPALPLSYWVMFCL